MELGRGKRIRTCAVHYAPGVRILSDSELYALTDDSARGPFAYLDARRRQLQPCRDCFRPDDCYQLVDPDDVLR